MGFGSRAGKIGPVSLTARHHWEVPSKLCCPGAKPWKWDPSLVTCYGIIPRV